MEFPDQGISGCLPVGRSQLPWPDPGQRSDDGALSLSGLGPPPGQKINTYYEVLGVFVCQEQ